MKPRRFLVRVFSNGAYDSEFTEQMVILTTQELVKTVRRYHEELLRLQKDIPEFRELRGSNFAPVVVPSGAPLPQLNPDFRNNNYAEIDAEPALKFAKLELTSSLICVNRNGVHWQFYPSHGHALHWSATLPFDVFLSESQIER